MLNTQRSYLCPLTSWQKNSLTGVSCGVTFEDPLEIVHWRKSPLPEFPPGSRTVVRVLWQRAGVRHVLWTYYSTWRGTVRCVNSEHVHFPQKSNGGYAPRRRGQLGIPGFGTARLALSGYAPATATFEDMYRQSCSLQINYNLYWGYDEFEDVW